MLDGAAVSTVLMENISLSVFKEGVGSKGTARLSALKNGVAFGNENSGRLKRRLETQDEIHTSSSSSSYKKRQRLNVSDAPTKNIFKAVHGENNMERVAPSGKPVETAREANVENKPVSKDLPPKNQDPLKESNGAPNRKNDKRMSENPRSSSKEKVNVSKDNKATSSLKEARDRKEVSRDEMVADRSRRDQRGHRSELRPRSGERSCRSVDRKRPQSSASRSRAARDSRGRERDRGHDGERRHLRYRRGEGESERDGDRSRSRTRCASYCLRLSDDKFVNVTNYYYYSCVRCCFHVDSLKILYFTHP